MQDIIINYWAVLVAGIASMVIGSLWYGPLFGKAWIAEMGFSKEKLEAMKKKKMANIYCITMILSLVMAYVLAHMIEYSWAFQFPPNPTAFIVFKWYAPALIGAESAFWIWLGFMVPLLAGNVLWEGKSKKLFALNAAYYLVTLVVMGIILAAWR